MVTQTRTDIAGVELPELEQALHDLGHPRFHARQIFQWIHKRGVSEFAVMSDLSRELRATLAAHFDIDTPLKQFVVAHPNLVRHCTAIHDAIR